MKAITLWQPWASLLACGAKEFETRSWATSYRGPIAIHAAAKKPSGIWGAIEPIIDRVRELLHITDPDELPRGAVIATAELVGCYKIVRYGGRGLSGNDPGWIDDDEKGIYFPSEQELMFGDWTPGRYAWELADVKILPEPIPVKGMQGLWNWEVTEGARGDVR